MAELMKMPAHITISSFNILKRIFKEENEAQKAAAEKEQSKTSAPMMPSMPSIQMPSIPHY